MVNAVWRVGKTSLIDTISFHNNEFGTFNCYHKKNSSESSEKSSRSSTEKSEKSERSEKYKKQKKTKINGNASEYVHCTVDKK